MAAAGRASRRPPSPTRAGAALERIADGLPAGSLAVVVSHGAAIRLGAARLLGLPEELWGVIGPLANCAWSVVVPAQPAVAAASSTTRARCLSRSRQ